MDNPRPGSQNQRGKSPRVLLAEDDDDTRFLIATVLRSSGCEVVETTSGAELLECLSASLLSGETSPPPDVIVTDVRMPSFSGTRVLAILRDANIRTPFVVITAFRDAATLREVKAFGANALFLKPFDIDSFVDVVHELASASAEHRGPILNTPMVEWPPSKVSGVYRRPRSQESAGTPILSPILSEDLVAEAAARRGRS